jgi:hypothetical protein
MINGVPTIGLDEDIAYRGMLVVNPNHQKRYFQFYVNGDQYPITDDYLEAFGKVVHTRIDFSYSMAVSLNEPVRAAPRGLIIVHLFKAGGEPDGPQPMMSEGSPYPRELGVSSTNEAPIANIVPDYLEPVEKYHIRLVPWNELKEVAQPTLRQEGWGPPITEEDRQVNQFWSPDHPW